MYWFYIDVSFIFIFVSVIFGAVKVFRFSSLRVVSGRKLELVCTSRVKIKKKIPNTY